VTVPRGSTLTIEAGVEVRFDGGTGLLISGRLMALGEEGTPVVLVRSGTSEWDGVLIDHGNDGIARESVLRHVEVSGAGNLLEVTDTRGSSILVEECDFELWGDHAIEWDGANGLIVRSSGFGLGTSPADQASEAIKGVAASAVVEGCTFGKRVGYNDAMDIADCRWSGPVPTIRHNTFLGGEDDAIDFDGADGWIVGNLVVDFWPSPGSSSANGGGITGDGSSRPVVAHNIVRRCYHGIGFKNGASPLVVGNLVIDCHVGATFYQSSCGASRPRPVLYDNIFWNNRHSTTGALQSLLLTGAWWPSYCASLESQAIADVRYSLIEGGWPGEGNLDLDPKLVDPAGGDFTLSPDSPALDAGFGGPFALSGADAAALAEVLGVDRLGVDPVDLECVADTGAGDVRFRDLGPLELALPGLCGGEGRFRRGDSNGDGALDISDPVTALLYLFVGAPSAHCEDALDANDDGSVNMSDALSLLEHLFQEGPAPSAPYPALGLDPTPDALGCAR
jgi:hypothetical protein